MSVFLDAARAQIRTVSLGGGPWIRNSDVTPTGMWVWWVRFGVQCTEKVGVAWQGGGDVRFAFLLSVWFRTCCVGIPSGRRWHRVVLRLERSQCDVGTGFVTFAGGAQNSDLTSRRCYVCPKCHVAVCTWTYRGQCDVGTGFVTFAGGAQNLVVTFCHVALWQT